MFVKLQENISHLKKKFSDSADFTVRNISLNTTPKTDAAIITIEGMCNKDLIALSITNPIVRAQYGEIFGEELYNYIKNSVLTASEIIEVKTFDELMAFIMSGFAVVAVDGSDKMIAVGVQGFSFRSVSEPESEVVQRGSREGFVEALRINMTLIRRRIKNPDLVFETLTVGELSQTQMCLCYVKSAVSPLILKELKRRLNSTNLSSVLASGYLTEFLEDDRGKSLFSGVGISERPDTVCGKIIEGRIAVMIDGTPSVLTVPFLFVENFQVMDDYSNRPYFTSFIRILKYFSFFVAIYLPALYLAISNFHPEMLPSKLLEKINISVSETPLPLIFEVLVIYFEYEIMREAGLRLPKPLGHAISIIGGLVIGESAVSAGIIGSPTLMVVALSAICSYVVPDLYPPITVLRFLFIIIGGVLGMFGIILFSCVLVFKICAKTSFSVPFAAPLAPFSKKSMGDVFIRDNWYRLSKNKVTVQSMPGTEEELFKNDNNLN